MKANVVKKGVGIEVQFLGWYASGTRFSATQSHPCGPPDAPDVPCRYDEGEIFGVEGSAGKAPARDNDMWYFSEMSEVNLRKIVDL